MRVVFIGPPGAGKGTQALRVSSHLGVTHLSTGEVLREARDQGTEIGVQAADHLEDGSLVPDALVVRVVDERLTNGDCERGYLFDGFPRTVAQAIALDGLLETRGTPLNVAVEFVVPHDELLKRLASRGREDDDESTIRERLRHYTTLTKPLADYYQQRGVLEQIDAVGSPDEVFDRLCKVIERHRSQKAG